MSAHTLTPAARWLGYAGLLPQLIAVGLVWKGGELSYVALAGGFAYAALIFSFLGGVWWGQSIAVGKADASAYAIAVLPSLISLVLFLPWNFGWRWPEPSLIALGALIAASPLVDRWLELADRSFMGLRWHLSLGLGAATIGLGLMGIGRV